MLKRLDIKNHKFIKNIFSCTGRYKDKKNYLTKLKIDKNTALEISKIEFIIKNFLKTNKNVNIFLDFCEIDNKNYHSGVRFTFFANNVRGEIAKGGRYIVPNFMNEDKVDVATGFTCYMDSILRASSSKFFDKKILIPFKTSKIKVNYLIKNNFTIFKYTGDLKIEKKLVKKYNCQFYLQDNSVKTL